MQPFLLSSGGAARVVEARWDWRKGVSVRLYLHPRTMVPGVEVTYTVSDLAEIQEVATSMRTEQVRVTLDQVRLIIEKAALRDAGGLQHLSIRMLQDIEGLWYFLGIQAVQVRPRPQSPVSDIPPALRTVDSIHPLTSPRSEQLHHSRSPTVYAPQPSLFSRKSSLDHRLRMSKISSTTDLRRGTSSGVYRYPQTYVKEQEVEAEVAKLLELDVQRPEANITYKSWSRRANEGPRLTLVDQLYAKSLCRQKRLVFRQSCDTLKALQQFKARVIAGTDEMLFQAEMAERIAGKPKNETTKTVDLSQYSKFSKIRQEKMEKEQRERREKECIERVIQDSLDKYTAVTLKIRTEKAGRKTSCESEG